MFSTKTLIGCTAATLAAMAWASSGARAQDPVARGKYLAVIGGCTDCHTPGYFFGKPDEKRYLGGSEVGFEIPGLGVFHGPNLTPDKETGLGNWSSAEMTALRPVYGPDRRVLARSCRGKRWRNSPGRRGGDRCLSQDVPPVKNNARPVRAHSKADRLRDEDRAATEVKPAPSNSQGTARGGDHASESDMHRCAACRLSQPSFQSKASAVSTPA
jgi:hypothetical protein